MVQSELSRFRKALAATCLPPHNVEEGRGGGHSDAANVNRHPNLNISTPMPVTVQDVAAAANVSPATVSRVLNNRHDVSAETIRLVEAAIQRVGYERNSTRRGRPPVTLPSYIRQYQGKVANSLAFLFPVTQNDSLRSPLTTHLVDGVESVAREHDINFHLARLSEDRHLPVCLDPVQVDGLIVRSTPGGVRALPAIPTVWVFKPDYHSAPGDVIQPDNEMIGDLAAQYLLEAGHQKIAVVTARKDHAEANLRADRFVRTLEKSGVAVLSILSRDVDKIADQLLAHTPIPTGLFLPLGDAFLERLYRALHQRGIRCGGRGAQMEIISCNNEATHLRLLDPTLANIDIRADEIGRTAVRALLWRIQNPTEHRRTVLIEPELIEAAEPIQ